MNVQALLTKVARAHLGISMGCLAATSATGAYQLATREGTSARDMMVSAAIISFAWPVTVPYSLVTMVSDWRHDTHSTYSANFTRHVTSNKT